MFANVAFGAAGALPPARGEAAVVTHWNAGSGTVSQFDLEFWADDTSSVTAGKIYGGVLHDFVLADDDVDTVDFANNELDLTGHAYATGDGPVQLTTTDTLPTGLALATDYYISVVNANTIQLHTTWADAMAGTNAVTFSDVGVGTHTIEDTAETQRVHWLQYGNLGPDGDGAVTLSAFQGWTQRFGHRPRTVAYAISATVSAANVWASIFAVLEE